MLALDEGADHALATDGGLEVYVLSGALAADESVLPAGGWVRRGTGTLWGLHAQEATTLLVRQRHLRDAP